MFSMISKNRPGRGSRRCLLCTGSIPELAETPLRKKLFRLQSKITLPSISYHTVFYSASTG